MEKNKKVRTKKKQELHPRNKHVGRYDLKQLIETCPQLEEFVKLNNYNDLSIDFFDPKAVKMLNKSLLKHFYGINNWDVPQGYLTPPIPGRADYIHNVADLLSDANDDRIPVGKDIKCLDIGVGANCVYPIIGTAEYGWSFVGSEIDSEAIESAKEIINANTILTENVELRLQNDSTKLFKGIIKEDENFDLVICNPPFHSSAEEAKGANTRKLSNLKGKRISKPALNFGGKNTELWCLGGEEKFVTDMIFQSKEYSESCFWFSTLISKQSHLESIYNILKRVAAVDVITVLMGQGNKKSRIVSWTFLTAEQQKQWKETKWNSFLKKEVK